MGILSAIGGAISSVCSAVCSGIGKVCSGIGGSLGKLGGAISNFAERIVMDSPLHFPKLELPEIFRLIGNVVSVVAEALGLKQPEKDDPEELGLKAEEADKKPDDFESTEKYIEYLQNEIKCDKEKQKNLSPEEKMAYTSIGSHLYMEACCEKLGMKEITPEILVDAAKLQMDAKEIIGYINSLRNNGFTSTKQMSDYLRGKSESFETAMKVDSAMTEALKELEPEMSDNDIAEKIMDMKSECTL